MICETYHLILDSGSTWFTTFNNLTDAREALRQHNSRVREAKARGDLVTLRLAVAVARTKPEAIKAATKARLAKARKPRRKRA